MDTVVVGTTQKEDDSDKYDVLDRVLEDAGFWNTLEERFLSSGKTKKDFLIALKPNLMMFYSKEDMSVITEPGLVEHLITKISGKGFTNIALVESQNVFGNCRRAENVGPLVDRFLDYGEELYGFSNLASNLSLIQTTFKLTFQRNVSQKKNRHFPILFERFIMYNKVVR